MKYHVRFLISWKMCKNAVKVNAIVKIYAATREGW
jgi:hypothetical protein